MGYILSQRVEALPRPFVIVCEGFGDVCFVDALLTLHKIDACSVGCHSRETQKKAGGKNLLDDYLAGISFARTRKESANISGLLIVVDADDDPDGQFNMAAEALQDNGFPRPDKPFTIVSQNDFRTAVFMIPGKDRTGTLEHILLDATVKQNPKLGECVEKFAECTNVIPAATNNQQAKMKMSALVGACCLENPWASVGLLWKSKGNPVPIESDLFHPIVDFIREFCS